MLSTPVKTSKNLSDSLLLTSHCVQCGRKKRGTRGDLCAKCWRKTPEGKEWQRQRIADYRSKVAFRGLSDPLLNVNSPEEKV